MQSTKDRKLGGLQSTFSRRRDAAAPVSDLRSSSQSAFGGPCNSVAARLLDNVLAKIEPFYNRLY